MKDFMENGLNVDDFLNEIDGVELEAIDLDDDVVSKLIGA